jgi:hypothetical protein
VVPPGKETESALDSRAAGHGAAKAAGDTVTIHLTGVPKTASVFVNGEEMARPVTVPRSSKTLKIEAQAPGYTTGVKRVVPAADKVVRIRMARDGSAPGASSQSNGGRQKRLASNPFKS